ncbi:MAG: polysaccharide deacetylase family protein [Acidobacteriia bacterium]|jgi:peptidoglycan/xylan/chitin deacetylase (PgdA/CDA1 family)|nr:polysaccharide deacetylase family protein [Terriglobia bacterium]
MRASWRQRIRFALAELLYGSSGRLRRAAPVIRSRRPNAVYVLGLHRILNPEQQRRAHSLPGMVMRATTFARLLEFLGQNFRVISLDEFLSGDREPSNGRPACLITFDDGWRDNYTTAFPLLLQHRLPATIFLATGFIGTDRTFWPEQLLRAWQDPALREQIRQRAVQAGCKAHSEPEAWIECLKHMPAARREDILRPLTEGIGGANGDAMLSWEEAAEMARAGIRFGSHTVTHPLLTYEDEATVMRELSDSRQQIETKLQQPVRAFAYPNGNWNPQVREHVKEAGFACAFTVRSGVHRAQDDLLTVRRFLLHEGCVVGRDGNFSAAVTRFRLAWGR